MSGELTGHVRLADMRAKTAADVENLSREICRMREALGRAEERMRIAERELVYWTNVREPEEVLRECGVEGPFELVTSGTDFVRDGVSLRRCNRTHPCPDHGRPLGASDWRLHPVNGEVEPELLVCPVHQSPVLSGELCPRCQTDGEQLAAQRPLHLPTPAPDL